MHRVRANRNAPRHARGGRLEQLDDPLGGLIWKARRDDLVLDRVVIDLVVEISDIAIKDRVTRRAHLVCPGPKFIPTAARPVQAVIQIWRKPVAEDLRLVASSILDALPKG